jgi:hypothetical protein
MKRAIPGAAILVFVVTITPEPAMGQAPANWRAVRETDAAQGAAAVDFQMMPPGWHITTGAASLLFDPRRVVDDRFSLTAEMFVFPETKEDGYGIFVGGRQLDGNAAHYIALQLRRDGSAAVFQRNGSRSTPLINWKRIDAVPPHPGTEPQKVSMSIETDSTSLRFTANGVEIGRVPRSGLDFSGQFGFRIGNNVNLHIVRLDVSERLAPARRNP